MELQEAEEAAKLDALREAARVGFGALDRGEFKLVQAVVGKSAASLREV